MAEENAENTQGENSEEINPQELSKILSLRLNNSGEMSLQGEDPQLDEMEQHNREHLIADLLRITAEGMEENAAEVKAQEGGEEMLCPQNPGSLYDDIAFEAGIYVNRENGVAVNPSFGRGINPEMTLVEALGNLAASIREMADEIHPDHGPGEGPMAPEQGNESFAPTPPPGVTSSF